MKYRGSDFIACTHCREFLPPFNEICLVTGVMLSFFPAGQSNLVWLARSEFHLPEMYYTIFIVIICFCEPVIIIMMLVCLLLRESMDVDLTKIVSMHIYALLTLHTEFVPFYD